MVEWVIIEKDIAVVADKGHAWLHKLDSQTQRPWASPMTGAGCTRKHGAAAQRCGCVRYQFQRPGNLYARPLCCPT